MLFLCLFCLFLSSQQEASKLSPGALVFRGYSRLAIITAMAARQLWTMLVFALRVLWSSGYLREACYLSESSKGGENTKLLKSYTVSSW